MTIAISPGEAIQIVVEATGLTAESPVICAFADQGGDVGPARILTTGITPAVITTGPTNLGSAARVVSSISVYNADTISHTYTFQYVDASSALYTILKALVPNGWTLSYENGAGWRLVDNDGNFRETVFAYQAGTWTVAVSNFPALQAVNLTQVANSTLTSPSDYGTAPTGTVIGVNSFVTNPISQGVAAALAGAWPIEVTDGTNILGTVTHALRIDPTGTTTQPVSVSNFPGVQTVNLTQVANSTLTAPSNYGTAPTGTVVGVNAFVTNAVAVTGTFWQATQPVSGTVTANAGTGTFTVSDSNFIAQGSTTSGQKGLLLQGAVTTADPSYATAQTSPISLNTSGQLRVTLDGSALPTGANTIGAVTQASGPWTQNLTQVGGNSVALGRTTMASSIPVISAVDQGALGAETIVLTTNSANTLAASIYTRVRSIYIVNVGAVLAAGSVNLSIIDGGGTTRSIFSIPTAVSTALPPYTVIDVSDLCVTLVNGGNPSTVKLSSSLTSGAIVLGFSVDN